MTPDQARRLVWQSTLPPCPLIDEGTPCARHDGDGGACDPHLGPPDWREVARTLDREISRLGAEHASTLNAIAKELTYVLPYEEGAAAGDWQYWNYSLPHRVASLRRVALRLAGGAHAGQGRR